jgi:hypothetical protein
MLQVLDTLKLPKEDPAYLQSIYDLAQQSESGLAINKSRSNSDRLADFRRKLLWNALHDG